MATPVSLALKAQGVEEVKTALRGVKSAFVDMERESLAATKAASKERIAILKAESKEKIALLKDESKARRETMSSEAAFRRTIGRAGGESGLGAARDALVKGEGVASIMKAAGATGLAVAAFTGAINLAGASLRQFSSFVVNDVVKPMMAIQTRAQQVANNSGGAMTADQVQSRARATAVRNNLDPMAVIDAAGAFQDFTGEAALGFDMMGLIGTLSKGRGGDMKELASLAASQFKPGMGRDELTKIMLALTGQGDKGSITVGEYAKVGGRAAAVGSKLGGDAFTRATTASAFIQAARPSIGSPEMAVTAFERFVQESFTKGRRISPRSIGEVGGVETLADPVRYLGDLFRKTHGDAKKLTAMGLGEETQKFSGAFSPVYSAAYTSAKGSGKDEATAREAAAVAVEDYVNALKRSTSTMEGEEARRASVVATSGERFAQGMDLIKGKLADQMSPAVEKLAASFLENSDAIVRAGSLLGGVLVDAAEGVVNLIEWWDRLTNNKGEGDVLKTVVDKGAKTVLPNMSHEKGYWMHADGVYKYIKGNEDKSVDDTANKGLRRTFTMPSGVGIYERDDGRGGVDPARVASFLSPAPLASVDPGNMSVDTGGAQTGPQAAAGADTLATSAQDAADACGTLKSCVDDLVVSMNELVRTKPFTDR